MQDDKQGRKTENSAGSFTTKLIKLIHTAQAKATQAIEQHIAPEYEAVENAITWEWNEIWRNRKRHSSSFQQYFLEKQQKMR